MTKITKYVGIFERCATIYRNCEFKSIGLSGTHHMYLFYINRNEGASQESLVKVLHINKSNVARSLKILEEDGFIYRQLDENDKRAYKVFLTSKGKEVIPFIREKIISFNKIVLNDFTLEEEEQLEKLLLKATRNAANYINLNYEDE